MLARGLILLVVLSGVIIYADELTLNKPVEAKVLEEPTCLHIEPNAESDLVVCLREGTTVKLVGRSSAKDEVDGVSEYWWEVELADGSFAWVFGGQIEIEKPSK